MLFIETKTSTRLVDGATRLLLLEKLQETNLIPVIRTARLAAYELALGNHERVTEMERALAARAEAANASLYVRGDLFFSKEFVLFLIFGSNDDELTGMRAGIVYESETSEPTDQLDAFCRNVYSALEAARRNAGKEEFNELDVNEWKRDALDKNAGLERFVARHGRDNGASDEAKPLGTERALEVLEDADVRRFLRRVIEAKADGRLADVMAQHEDDVAGTSLINKLSEVGLLQREVSVSCRQSGRSLFRLPSPDTLAVITASNALCSECGVAIADEKIDETIVPAERASSLLSDGSWLLSQLRSLLNGLGVHNGLLANGNASVDGEVHLMANVCNEPFLVVLRDGDLTAALTHSSLDELIETEGRHLVVIATGKIQEEARVRLREHARRRAREGSEIEVILIEGMDAAMTELQHAFERASQRAIIDAMCKLDSSLGLSVGFLVATRFRLAHKPVALTELAASAVGALAGSLREI